MRVHDSDTGKTFFRKRRRRYEESKEPRELTFSCYKRYRLLESDRSREWFAEAVQIVRREWPIDIWAYALMPEHVHLLVAPRELGVAVGKFAGKLKEIVARNAIAWLEEHAPHWLPRITVQEGKRTRRRFWQPGGGYDRNVTVERTLLSMIDYIHQNPVRRGLVARAEDWIWSSARFYAGLSPVPLEMDRTLPMIYE